jgi:integrase
VIFKVQKRPSRQNGKLVETRCYYLRYRIGAMPSDKWKSLGVSDKQTANKLAQDFLAELQREEAGIIEPKLLRDAAKRPLKSLLEDFITDLETKNRAGQYIRDVRTRLGRLFTEARWNRFADITPEAFQRWRSAHRHEFAAKTLNEYLATASNFLRWSRRNGWLKFNPLKGVERIDGRGRESYVRRALTDDELRRLVAAGGEYRGFLYHFAARTGLRRNEIKTLTWRDLHLDDETPFFVVKVANAKNRTAQPLPLLPELVPTLKRWRALSGGPADPVFARTLPRVRDMARDLAAAGVVQKDAEGRLVDFHALRHTFNTFLQCNGVGLRIAQQLMRHSDPKLTGKVYLTESMLPTKDAIRSLPALLVGEGYTQIRAQISGADSPQPSLPVAVGHGFMLMQPVGVGGVWHAVSQAVASGGMVGPTGLEPVTKGL